jgi:cytochrome b pre-mRNA-processing protein 3
MLNQLVRFFRPNPLIQQGYGLYAIINEEARAEYFFTNWGAPDTMDGRFELILLHMFIYLHSMKQRMKEHGGDTTELQRKIIEAFFDDMDRSFREFGVGDTGVGKRIKKMANAFYGRINAFEKSLHDDTQLTQALLKNSFATCETPPVNIQEWVGYVRARIATLTTQPIENIAFLET